MNQRWGARCKPATSAFNASDTRCESPQTVLRHLFRNGALEKAQCDAGFCAALGFGANASQALAQCEAQGYGVFPCTSTVYDWRDGTLAPEVDWPALLASQVCENAGAAAWSKGPGSARSRPCGHPPPGSPHPPACAQTDGEASRPNGEASPRGLRAVKAAAALWCHAKVADPAADYLYP